MLKNASVFATIIVLMFCMACQKDEIEIHSLEGTWIEVEDRSDTLVFNEIESFFILNRGKEERTGHILPKLGSGLYQYKLQDGVISVYNTYSSSLDFQDVPILIDKNIFMIGDFYQKDKAKQSLLTFERLP